MKSKSITIFIMINFILYALTVSFSQQLGTKNKQMNGGSLGNIYFTHHKHQKMFTSCIYCHRLFPKVAGSIDKLKASGKLRKKVVMKSCTKCHIDKIKKKEKSGPVACSGCHKK